MANDLGFTEVTIAVPLGHGSGSVTSRDVHTLDAALVVAAGLEWAALANAAPRTGH